MKYIFHNSLKVRGVLNKRKGCGGKKVKNHCSIQCRKHEMLITVVMETYYPLHNYSASTATAGQLADVSRK